MGLQKHGMRSSCRTARAPGRMPLAALQCPAFVPVSLGSAACYPGSWTPRSPRGYCHSRPWDEGQDGSRGASAGSADASSPAPDPTAQHSAEGSSAEGSIQAGPAAARRSPRAASGPLWAEGRLWPPDGPSPQSAELRTERKGKGTAQGSWAAGESNRALGCPSVVRRWIASEKVGGDWKGGADRNCYVRWIMCLHRNWCSVKVQHKEGAATLEWWPGYGAALLRGAMVSAGVSRTSEGGWFCTWPYMSVHITAFMGKWG